MLLTAGILGYKAFNYYQQTKRQDAAVAFQDNVVPEDKADAGKNGISKNLIYCYDKHKNITKMVLEVLDSKENKLTYITIPQRTQTTMSASLYKKLVLDYPEVPQVMKLEEISDCFDSDKQYSKGLLIIQDLLKLRINYYTALPQSIYNEMFTERNIMQTDGNESVQEAVLTSQYTQRLRSYNSAKKMKAYFKEIYPDIKTNLNLKEKQSNAEGYYKAISKGNISFDLVKGDNVNSAYVIDTVKISEQLADFQ